MASDGRGLMTLNGALPTLNGALPLQNPAKVKATVAMIPVGTEPVTKQTTVACMSSIYLLFVVLLILVYSNYFVLLIICLVYFCRSILKNIS